MLKSVKGICRNGKIELLEPPPADAEQEVLVTFISPESVQLSNCGIDENQAADLRRRLAAFSEDWQRPDMDVYNAI